MSDSINLSTFPSNKIDALTLLYLEQQNLSDLTPEELVDKYIEVHNKILDKFKTSRNDKRKVISSGVRL